MEVRRITDSEKETEEFARQIAQVLIDKNVIITMHGELGAGKTAFVRGFAKGLGFDENVTSPTFTIMNSYNKEKDLYHFDMYRLSSRDELVELGLEEYLDKRTLVGISIIEWPENIGYNNGDIKITINKLGDSKREYILEAEDAGYLYGV